MIGGAGALPLEHSRIYKQPRATSLPACPSVRSSSEFSFVMLSPAFAPAWAAGDKLMLGKEGSCVAEWQGGEEVKRAEHRESEGWLESSRKEDIRGLCLSHTPSFCTQWWKRAWTQNHTHTYTLKCQSWGSIIYQLLGLEKISSSYTTKQWQSFGIQSKTVWLQNPNIFLAHMASPNSYHNIPLVMNT
jgi:hypothetical protein